MRRAAYLASALCASAWLAGCLGSSSGGGPAPTFTLPETGVVDGTGGDVGLADAATGDGLTADGAIATGGDLDASTGADAGAVGGDGAIGSGDSGGSGTDDAQGGTADGALSLLDGDLDGFSPFDGDCDDEDKAVFPGAPEACDGKDNDCDGSDDDVDGDGDGFSLCPGAKADCDDADPKIHPGAPRVCDNGKDNDCDGAIDGANTDDVDGDGVAGCLDCDDNDPNIQPGAAKNCSNGKDNDCNGQIDGLEDGDGDGYLTCAVNNADCDDADPKVFPLAPETCNGKDDDCTGVVDDLDLDGDGWNGCGGGDCDDADIAVNPQAPPNCKNGKDNNCDGTPDDQQDHDKDGFIGCADCDDTNPAKSPNSWELPSDQIDNNCDGQTDEVPVSCDVAPMAASKPEDYVRAIDLCPPKGSTIVSGNAFAVLASPNARSIKADFGPPNKPTQGQHFVVLASGNAAAKGQSNYVLPQPGTSFSNTAPYPNVKCNASGSVNDYTEWKLTLKVPGNVNGMSFQFNFMSAEYPEWVGTQFNDKFLAVLDSKKFKGNISFDEKGSCVSINNAFFTVCNGCKSGAAGLQGTGYEGGIGGGTGWLTTTSPVEPGETITLRFIVFDEGDRIYDSAVLIDNFRWEILSNGQTTPSTVRPGG